jgi:hypothetical protein
MDTDGGNPRKLHDVGENRDVDSVQWSPDGTKLLYLKYENFNARRSIEILESKAAPAMSCFLIRSFEISIGYAMGVCCT